MFRTDRSSRPVRQPVRAVDEPGRGRRLRVAAATSVLASVAVVVPALTGEAAPPSSAGVPARAVAPAAVLTPGPRLWSGARLVSGTTQLRMQTDGNLVLYTGTAARWASHTNGHRGNYAVLKANGQLVVRAATGRIRWASPVGRGSGPRLVVSDGKAAVRTSTGWVWTVGAVAAAVAPATTPRTYARGQLARYGWNSAQWPCLDSLWTRESNWNPRAANPSSSAYGIPQALPGSKMASAGPDWRTNDQTQITWGLRYIADRYGSPCSAWSHSQQYGWYGTPTGTPVAR